MTPRFAPDAVIRRIDGEGIILLGGGRALLLQLAHPAVAAGVAEHSEFERDPLGRLFGTLEATYTIVFGTEAEVERMADRVRSIHQRVTGDGYRAGDPELLCWVNATLVDTAVHVYERWVGPLTVEERDEYVRDSRHVAHVLGCPLDAQPADWSTFRTY
ncbi:MAG: oxygenase MpaB family protein, partial [Actinomycetota bacterium]